jgi:aspartate aminotransferase-like enzyme
MSVSGRYWLPGPVEIDPDVARAMTAPMIGHHTTAGHALAEQLQHGLRALFATTRPVSVATASATAMMEAAIRSGVRQRLLAVVGGAFGERFAQIAERSGKEVVRLRVPRGSVLEPEQLEVFLGEHAVDAISLVHVETDTGAVAPVSELIRCIRGMADVVTIVDAVASVGGMSVDPAAWDADFVLSASQKAVGGPPGLAFAVASDRFLARAREIGDRGLYLDAVHLHQCAMDGRFPQTPALNVCFGVAHQLERILGRGLADRFAAHRVMREHVEQWAAHQQGFTLMAPAQRRADTVSALRIGGGHGAAEVVARLARDGYAIAPGKDDDLDAVIRIGHMGDVTVDQLDHLLAILDQRT